MSLVFNDTTTRRGLIQSIERKLFPGDIGRISNSSNLLIDFTAEINQALDDVTALIISCGGSWQWDDSNFTDYPIIYTNIVSGQQDYPFTTDQDGNLILDIYKVVVKDASGNGRELFPVNQRQNDQHQQLRYIAAFYNGQNATGTPVAYDKTANGIFLNYIPNYNLTNGLEVYINREASYFTTSDTTKKPGFAGLFHDYLALKAAYAYASANGLEVAGGILRNGSRTGMLLLIEDMENAIRLYYGQRARDIKRGIRVIQQNNK